MPGLKDSDSREARISRGQTLWITFGPLQPGALHIRYAVPTLAGEPSVRLRLTLLHPAARTARELLIDADPGATVRTLVDAAGPCVSSRETDGPAPACWVDGIPVPDTAVLGLPPLLDRACLTLRSAEPGVTACGPAGQPPPSSGLLQLHAVAGPDTGLVHDLPPGRHRLGRAGNADIPVDDPSLSREHAEITVSGRTVTVCDLGSTNGTCVDGIPVGSDPVPLAAGVALQTGDSQWRLRTPEGMPAASRPDREGHLLVSRSPRLSPPSPPGPITFPEPPTTPAAQSLPLVAAFLPLAFSGVLALVMHSATMLLFGLMGPLLLLSSWLSDRRAGRRSSRAEQRRYAAALARATADLDAALADERGRRLADDPDPARLGSRALGPRAGLWDRTGEPTLRVRVGVGTVPAEHPVRGRTDHVTLPASPVVIELDAATGIVGPREPAVRLARWIVGQLALRYSPAELAISLAGSAGPDSDGDSDIEQEWGWVRLLPHGCDNDDASAGSAHRTVVIVDGTLSSSACDLPRPQEGVHVLALAGTATTLPSACTQIIDLTPAGPRLTGTGPAVADLVPDGVPGAWTTLVATRLAPLRDAAAPARLGGLPAKVTLQELLLLPQRDGIPDLARVWREDPRSTRAPLGVSALGPLTIDLVRDGPHALVGGTTGSGKSELLVSLVAALAAGNRPDELCFVLVDYKGGAAFGACRDLPHVVGLVTDLDHQLTERALVSLGAELKRRERVFGERGVGDLAAYQRVCGPNDPAVPRLVIIVDEFRSLAEELPDFVAGLVRVASLGRSLGVHLVVATQRPAGVVTADMRANLGLRIALRVRDAVDSFDVVESPVAATIAANTPGRAVVTSAAMPLTLAQTALATAPRRRSGEPGIRVLSVDGLALPQPPTEAATEGRTELDDLVAGCRRAVDELGISVPASPWLAPLPAVLPITDLGAGSGWPVPLGLRDLPAAQRQAPWTWDPLREGHLGIVGAPRTGRTSALSTLAAQLATRFTPTELHLYAVHTGSLLGLESLPHVGASVRGDDLPRLAQLLSILTDPPDPTAPVVPLRVLLVDDWDRVGEELDRARAGVLRDRLAALLRCGPREQLAVALAGGRAALAGSLGQLVSRRLLLLPADPIDLAMAGLSSASVPQHPAPGRAIDPADGTEVQLATLVPEPTAARCAAYLRELAEQLPSDAGPVPGVATLPALVTVGELLSQQGVLVIGTDGTGSVGFEPSRGQRQIAVLGHRGTGRTTALCRLAHAIAGAGRPLAVIGALAELPTAAMVFGIDDADGLIAARREHPDLAVLVDDAERVSGSPVEPVLREILRLVGVDDGLVVAASTIHEVARNPRALPALVASGGTGILLGQVAPGDEAALGLRGTLWSADLPGRGHLVVSGRTTPIQVAFPPRSLPSPVSSP